MQLPNVLLIAGSVLTFVVYFAHFFFGLKKTLAGAAVIAGIVLLSVLPHDLGLSALAVGFVSLICVTVYYHMKATVFAAGTVGLLTQSLAGNRTESLPGDRA